MVISGYEKIPKFSTKVILFSDIMSNLDMVIFAKIGQKWNIAGGPFRTPARVAGGYLEVNGVCLDFIFHVRQHT